MRENLKSLTSLRFFAAAPIVWLHANLYFPWASVNPDIPLNHGVSFFFVLSGFILTHVHGSERLSYSKFIRSRVARLWPMHLICLLAVVWFVRSDSQSFDGPGIAGKWISIFPNALLMQSWWPTMASSFSWNSVSWSISTEMFFYAMFPLLVVLLSRRPWVFVATCFLPLPVLWLVARAFNLPPTGDVFTITLEAPFYSFPPARLFEFGIGMLTCRIWQHLRPIAPRSFVFASVIELTATAVLLVWLLDIFPDLRGTAHQSPVFWQWYSGSSSCFAFALFIGMMASGRGILGRALAIKPLVLLGEASFALYMVHQIVMKIISLNDPDWASPVFVIGSCLLAAFAGHFLVERPGRKLILMAGHRRGAPTPVPA